MNDLMDAISYVFQHVKDSIKIEDKIFVSPTGRIFTRETLHELDDDPIPAPIEAQSLTALVEYLTFNPDELEPHTTIHVVSPTEVIVFGRPRATDSKRRVYFRANEKGKGTKASNPYLTFPETIMPATRAKDGAVSTDPIDVRLWELEAIDNIKDYIDTQLEFHNTHEAAEEAGVKLSVIG